MAKVKKTMKKAQDGLRAKADNTRVKSPVVKNTPTKYKDVGLYDDGIYKETKRQYPWDRSYSNIYKTDSTTGKKRELTNQEYKEWKDKNIDKGFNVSSMASRYEKGGKVIAKKAKSGAKVMKKAASKKK